MKRIDILREALKELETAKETIISAFKKLKACKLLSVDNEAFSFLIKHVEMVERDIRNDIEKYDYLSKEVDEEHG